MEKRCKERTLGFSMFNDWEDEKDPAKETKRKWPLSTAEKEDCSGNQEEKCFKKDGVIGYARCSERSGKSRTENNN